MAEVFDLDALVPQDAQVKFGENLYPVHPPTTEAVFRLTRLGAELEKAGIDEQANAAMQVFEALREEVMKCIPDLDGTQLTSGQLFGLAQFVIRLGIPKRDDLVEQDITAETAKKKQKRAVG